MTDNVKVAGFNDKQPAWWGLGKQPEYAYQWANVSEGFEAAGMDYKLSLEPFSCEINGQKYTMDNRRMVMREPSLGNDDYVPLDVVGDDFVLVQNSDIAEWFDPLCSNYKLATFGVLGEGETVWLALETEGFTIKGDDFNGYLFVYGKTAGGGSFGVGYTSVRVVCQNTLMQAESSALDLMKFSHKGNVKDLVKMRAWAEHTIAESRKQVVAQWELLVNTKFDELMTAKVIEKAFPEPKREKALLLADVAPGLLQEEYASVLISEAQKRNDKATETTNSHRLGVAHRLNVFNEEFPQYARTGYAVVNAITQYADWPDHPRSDTPRALMFGYRNAWKQRGFATALKLARPEMSDN